MNGSTMIKHFHNRTLELITGDITLLDVDAVVNAANSSLILGGGVAGAISRRGGPGIQRECDRIGGTPVGTAAITTGGNLPARFVIHAVGPRWGEGNEPEKLRSAVSSSLALAADRKLNSIAFPAISTGIFGFPIEPAAQIMLDAAARHLENNDLPSRVIFCLFSREDLETFTAALSRQGAHQS